MGNTLWLNIRKGDSTECNRSDHSIMYNLANQLDGIARRLGVRCLSDFYDYSDLEDEFAAEFDEDDDDEEADVERSIDDLKWFDAGEGLATVDALLKHINDHPELFRFEHDTSRGHWRTMLLDELEDCRSVLADAAREGRSFHLAVLM
jgi:hypothetical protein